MTDHRPTNPHAEAYASFLAQTADHELRVLRDDGLYRHLRVQKPGTRMWSWDVVTWPGHLATSGDIADGFVFARSADMLAFFARPESAQRYYSDGAPSIDVRYWAEKLCGGRAHEVKSYDPDRFLQQVRESLLEDEDLGHAAQDVHERQLELLARLHELRGLDSAHAAELVEAHWAAIDLAEASRGSSLRAQVQHAQDEVARTCRSLWSAEGLTDAQLDELDEQHDYRELAGLELPRTSPAERRAELIDDARWHAGTEPEARDWLADHASRFGSDTWEWDLREYDLGFLFACYCIEATTRLYAALPASGATTS